MSDSFRETMMALYSCAALVTMMTTDEGDASLGAIVVLCFFVIAYLWASSPDFLRGEID